MIHRIPALFILLLGISAMAQTTVTSYTPGVTTEGAAYYLPKTAINVSITTEKTTFTPGELCHYAERYLRVTGISNEADCYHSIQSVAISTEGLPDASKLYHILFTTGSVAPLVTLSETGVLLGVNVVAAPTAESPVEAPSGQSAKKLLSPRSFMTEEMLVTGSKAKLAELVAKEIYSIRESRNLIIRGQGDHMPQDGESFRLILAGLDEQEQAFMQLFTGVTTTEVVTQTYQVIPDTVADKLILGRFSRKLGLLHGDDLAGSPLYIDIKSKQPIHEPTANVPASTGKGKKGKGGALQDGLVYNLPGQAEVKVYSNTQVLASGSLPLAQFGRTETLSSTLLTKKKDVKVTLDPATGALLHVEE